MPSGFYPHQPHQGFRKGIRVVPLKEKPCKRCEQLFLPEYVETKFCSAECRRLYHNQRKKIWYLAHSKVKPPKPLPKYHWCCPDCATKRRLDFDPLKESKKLGDITCLKCKYNNKILE